MSNELDYRYKGNDNDGKPKQLYLDKIAALVNKELFYETKHRIWLSAYASNNPRSDYHWQCDACYDECKKRDPKMYDKAHKAVVAENT